MGWSKCCYEQHDEQWLKVNHHEEGRDEDGKDA